VHIRGIIELDNIDMIYTDLDNRIISLLESKEQEMVEFLNRYLSKSERTRIGEDIVRIMPNKGDIAKIKLDILIEENDR
jgi:hypothetical protein